MSGKSFLKKQDTMATTTGLSRRNYIVTGERGAIGSLIMDYFDNIFSINENMKKTDNGVLLHLAGSANTKRIWIQIYCI